MKITSAIQWSSIVYGLLAFSFGVAILYHTAALFFPAHFPPSPVLRHLLFIIINAAAFLLAYHRWKWFWIPFSALTVQQLISHGSRAYHWWVLQHQVDYLSILIIIFMPVLSVFLYYEFRLRMKLKN